MKKVISIIALMTFVSACAEPPPEHPTPKQWCQNLKANDCTEEQGFDDYDDCVEFMQIGEDVSKEYGCQEEWYDYLQCSWYFNASCGTSCDYEMEQWQDC